MGGGKSTGPESGHTSVSPKSLICTTKRLYIPLKGLPAAKFLKIQNKTAVAAGDVSWVPSLRSV